VKERLVICNEDTVGRARVTRDEERFLLVDWMAYGSCITVVWTTSFYIILSL